MTALYAGAANVSSTSYWKRCPVRAFSGLTESTKVHPASIAYSGECRPLRVPHATIGDARMNEDNGQVSAWAGAVICDSGWRARRCSHRASYRMAADDTLKTATRQPKTDPVLPVPPVFQDHRVSPREMSMKITTGRADPAVRTLLNVPQRTRHRPSGPRPQKARRIYLAVLGFGALSGGLRSGQ